MLVIMKKYSLVFAAVLVSMSLFSQDETATAGGSLIDDIMNVEVVSVNLEEGHEEARTDYEKEYEENLSKLNDRYAKIDDVYKKEVGKLIEEFTKVLGEGEQKYATTKKKSVASKIRTLSMTLKMDKKKELQNFNNTMMPQIRELPSIFHKDKTQEIKDKTKEDKDAFESEYKANLSSLEAFKKKEHLVISETTSSTSAEQ